MSEGTSPPPAALERAREFFNSFGDDITWRVCNRGLYERHLAQLLTEERTKALSDGGEAMREKCLAVCERLSDCAVCDVAEEIRFLKAEGGEK